MLTPGTQELDAARGRPDRLYGVVDVRRDGLRLARCYDSVDRRRRARSEPNGAGADLEHSPDSRGDPVIPSEGVGKRRLGPRDGDPHGLEVGRQFCPIALGTFEAGADRRRRVGAALAMETVEAGFPRSGLIVGEGGDLAFHDSEPTGWTASIDNRIRR
jgi:hypothetical protein